MTDPATDSTTNSVNGAATGAFAEKIGGDVRDSTTNSVTGTATGAFAEKIGGDVRDSTTNSVTGAATGIVNDLTPRSVDGDRPASRRTRKRWLPMVVLGLVLAAGGVIVTQFLRSAVDYYCNVDEIGVRNGCDAGRRLRLQGVVQLGTIEFTGATTEFVISFNGATVPVVYRGDPGGIFKECMPVIVHGRFDAEPGAAGAVFNGDLVEVKHSNEYVAENDARLDEAEQLAARCAAAGA